MRWDAGEEEAVHRRERDGGASKGDGTLTEDEADSGDCGEEEGGRPRVLRLGGGHGFGIRRVALRKLDGNAPRGCGVHSEAEASRCASESSVDVVDDFTDDEDDEGDGGGALASRGRTAVRVSDAHEDATPPEASGGATCRRPRRHGPAPQVLGRSSAPAGDGGGAATASTMATTGGKAPASPGGRGAATATSSARMQRSIARLRRQVQGRGHGARSGAAVTARRGHTLSSSLE